MSLITSLTTLRRAVAAALAICAAAVAAPAAAVSIAGGVTSVEVTADLAGLGLAGAPFGTATVDATGPNPVFFFPITGGELLPSGATILHEGSGVTLSALSDPSIAATVGNFVIETANARILGDVIGGAQDVTLFDLGAAGVDGIPVLIASDLAGALSAVFSAPDLTGAQFGLAATAPQPVPLPAAWALLLAGLGGVAALRGRRRA